MEAFFQKLSKHFDTLDHDILALSIGSRLSSLNSSNSCLYYNLLMVHLQSLRVGDLTLEDGAQPIKFPHVRVADKFM